MITVISGTNRKNSECLKFARLYFEMLKESTEEEVKLLALEHIPYDWFFPEMYTRQAPSLKRLQDEYILPATKFVFVTPEYNGSFPGAVKLFIDACTVRKYTSNFKGKKAALVGIATGRAGNLRGMEHLTGVLNFLGTVVMPDKLPISRISDLKDGEGDVIDEETLEAMRIHALEFLEF
ncbi:MAG: NAD(P)H-dependent oxidoreductase [Lewinellaceae bacterium]|nr:NAD(P)H-dependent oxidoreductase [Lewinellaceae bacterium]MCB9287036.1 NAD(P)H-dependent oxidoreductase [Lewinellaceae bacterium]